MDLDTMVTAGAYNYDQETGESVVDPHNLYLFRDLFGGRSFDEDGDSDFLDYMSPEGEVDLPTTPQVDPFGETHEVTNKIGFSLTRVDALNIAAADQRAVDATRRSEERRVDVSLTWANVLKMAVIDKRKNPTPPEAEPMVIDLTGDDPPTPAKIVKLRSKRKHETPRNQVRADSPIPILVDLTSDDEPFNDPNSWEEDPKHIAAIIANDLAMRKELNAAKERLMSQHN